jgi:hypothetical protein
VILTKFVIYSALSLTYLGLALGYIPGFRMNRATIAYSGFFRKALVLLLRCTRIPLGLLIVITFGCGIISACFLNDTIALIFTPLSLSLTLSLDLNPIPYLLAVAGANNSFGWEHRMNTIH